MPEEKPLRGSIALAAYAEPILAAGRVLVVGEATTPLVERLLERGARLVHVVDADAGRVAEAAAHNADSHASFAPLGPGGLPVRDGAFDVAIIEDLATVPEPEHVLRQVRRALGARGTALVACRNPDAPARLLPLAEASQAPDYYAFYDLVTGVFEQVRMLGQSPFVGYAVCDFAPEGDLEPVLDVGFVPGGAEEPEWFVAVAAREATPLETLMIVQLTTREVLAAGDAGVLERQLRAARAAERQSRERLVEVEAALARRGDEASAQERGERVARLEAELQRSAAWAQQLEGRAATADARADAVQAEFDAAEERASATAREHAALAAKHAALAAKHAALEAKYAPLAAKHAALEAKHAALEAKHAALEAKHAPLAAKHAALEAKHAALEAKHAPLAATQGTLEAKHAALVAELAAERRRQTSAPVMPATAVAELARVKSELAAARGGVAALEAKLEALSAARAEEQRRLTGLAAIEEQAARDVASLEAQLVERAREIQARERAAREAARAGAELVAELDRLRDGQGIDALRANVADLGRRNAELVAELQAAEWALAAQRADSPVASALAPDAPAEALRAALATAEARVREQAVLLEQLRASASPIRAERDPSDPGEPSLGR